MTMMHIKINKFRPFKAHLKFARMSYSELCQNFTMSNVSTMKHALNFAEILHI